MWGGGRVRVGVGKDQVCLFRRGWQYSVRTRTGLIGRRSPEVTPLVPSRPKHSAQSAWPAEVCESATAPNHTKSKATKGLQRAADGPQGGATGRNIVHIQQGHSTCRAAAVVSRGGIANSPNGRRVMSQRARCPTRRRLSCGSARSRRASVSISTRFREETKENCMPKRRSRVPSIAPSFLLYLRRRSTG